MIIQIKSMCGSCLLGLKTKFVNLIYNMKILNGYVKQLLEQYPHLRDDDKKLIANVWHQETIRFGITDGSIKDFLGHFANGRFSHPESIMRSRRKYQELHPELRGEKYNQRHRETKTVQQELGYGRLQT